MFIDFRELDDGTTVQADICVIGAGAAGITIARELAGTQAQVCLVESGGFELETETQGLYEGTNVGLPYSDLDVCRLRFFGGTTNHWEGWCTPLSEGDFKQRPWVPHSGWPISKAELDPFYERAQSVCNLGPYRYEEDVWELLGGDAPEFDREKVQLRFWQIPPAARFGEAYRGDLEKSENVDIYLHANVVGLHSNETTSAVEHVDVRTLDGKAGRIVAKVFVLACGAIENARLLLLSNEVAPHGLGNLHDLVGRFFMEHPEVRAGAVMARDPFDFLETFWMHWHADTPYLPTLSTGDETQRREEVLNCGASILYEPDPESGIRAARKAWSDMKHGRVPDELDEKVWQVMIDLDDIIYNAYRSFIEGQEPIEPPKLIYTEVICEQAPNPQSRVSLSHDRDALGLNRIKLDWRLTNLERRSIEVLARTIGLELGRLDLARFRLSDWLVDPGADWPSSLHWGNHHMGTTRMATHPRSGVVDKDCRVHGIGNLYIAGSSVFPTSGYANPTLTIVALSLRLADKLKSAFG